ncbi:hypothetical protein [Pontivivens ytuae]|uniref:Uncharacterized protein n=1 Tax=Pontivivens ytuae TaxID=2789856 RepID=A0A7S9LU55_9RHOB|nr:hypothetical protein [Pontivivens ytuae]QPH55314.1 hypothetical protein I0K15_06125 [Pontivivens ytuae]
MKIAILGWGSLIWDIENLEPHVAGDWHMRGGPELPMEFSRISPKRKMGLVVCLDPQHGAACPTHAIRSTRARLTDAVSDLARRERAPEDLIGRCTQDGAHGRLPEVNEAVMAWCRMSGHDGAVWTDLEPNFLLSRGVPFSVKRGMDYLRTLEGESLAEAHRYIEEAPSTTMTPLRRALTTDPWWQALRAA